jgi:hypothetical protein
MDPIALATACYQCMLENSVQEDVGLAAVGMCDAAPDNQKLASLVVASSDQRNIEWLKAIKSCMLACIHKRLQSIFHDARGEATGVAEYNMQGDYYKGILHFVQEMFDKDV